MGRRESPLADGDGPVARFAADLRALRIAHGEKTYRQLAASCFFSAATLARAASGRAMPSLEVTLAYVAACDGDPAEWRRRWEAARRELVSLEPRAQAPAAGDALQSITRDPIAGEQANQGPAATGEPTAPDARPRRRRPLILSSLLVCSLAVNVVLALTASTSHAPQQPVLDGTDPVAERCDDAVSLDVKPVRLQATARIDGRDYPAGTSVGTVSLRFSRQCAGAWARFDPAPGLFRDPDEADITVQAGRPAEGAQNTWRLGHLDQTYSDLLLTGMGCVQASAIVTVYDGNVTAEGTTGCLPKMS